MKCNANINAAGYGYNGRMAKYSAVMSGVLSALAWLA